MLRGVCVVAGPARSGKTHRLTSAYREALATGPLGAALWLSPSYRTAAAAGQQLLAGARSGCFSPNCLTFDQFSRRVLDASALRIRPIGPTVQRQILRRLIDEASRRGQLRYFGPIAATPGFLDLVVGTIQELKRLEIWPEHLMAACQPRATQKDQELNRLYHEYQRLLTDNDLYDVQGRFWKARDLMSDGWRRPFENVRHVFVDGFTDFTRTEHEILEILAGRVDSLSISLPLEAEAARSEMFAKSTATLAELGRRHPRIVVERLARPTVSWPAMAHLESHLFANARQAAPALDTDGIEIVAAGGVHHEIELLARRIKQLLIRGDAGAGGIRVRAADILVVFRSLSETADLVREVFGRFGVPCAIDARPPLERAPLMSALLGWLRLERDDWPFRQVLAMLGHNYFRPKWPEWNQGRAVAAAEQWVRRLQIPAGRAALKSAMDHFADHDSTAAEGSPDRRALVARQAQLAGPLLARVGQSLDDLPEHATLAQWAGAISKLANSLGLLDAAGVAESRRRDEQLTLGFDDAGALPVGLADRAAWRQLIASLHGSDQLSTCIDGREAIFSRREFFDHLCETLRCEPLALDPDETARVRVLSAENARNLSAPYVFVAGLSEKAFPPPNQEDCLYSDAQTRQLISAGLPLVAHAQRSGHEMLLFYEVITRATRRLVLSYPALDDRAQPLSPSPYLEDLDRACGPGRIPRTAQPELTGVPVSDDVLCPRDFRVRAVSNALAGDASLLTELFGHPSMLPAADNLAAGLRVSCARQRGKSFGPFEGLLPSTAAGRALRARFGPERCWSASRLEQYASCPFQFFLSRVLHLEALDEPMLEIDHLNRGRMLHWLLAALHRKLNERGGAGGSPVEQTDEQFLAEVGRLVGELLERMPSDHLLAGGLLELDARRVSAWLSDYRRQHGAYDVQWSEWDVPPRPAHFEVAFGPVRQGDDEDPTEGDADNQDPLSRPEPFELSCGQETVRFSGRIDRIDIGAIAGQTVFNIVDYKSGRSSRRTSVQSVAEGYSLQLPLYALAARELLAERRAIPFRAGYWHVGGDGYKEVIEFHADSGGRLAESRDWESLEAQLRSRVGSLVEGIRHGEFPMHSADDKCTSHCPYHTVCRVNQVRALGKTWEAGRDQGP
jgi:ATP-dependent helicase/nuclease subunit B